MIVTVDGGADEKNPRYEKTINQSIKYFVENGLDAFFFTTNVPGCSAFNRVERRMVKLGKELVVPKRFLLPPLQVVHTRNGNEWGKDAKDANYLSLYQNISLQNALMSAQARKKFPKRKPYDNSCPYVDQEMIKRRMCSHCG